MHAGPLIDDMADELTLLLQELATKPEVRRHDLQRLRCTLHCHGPINRRQAAQFFHTNRVISGDLGPWHELYLAALTGFFLEYHLDKFVLTEQSAAMLLGWLGDEEAITNVGERRLTLRLLLRAAEIPETFEHRILQAIAQTLTSQSVRWSSADRRIPGLIDAIDLHLIGCLVRRPGHRPPNRLTSSMIAFMLDLEHGPCRFADASAWRLLLVDGLASNLSHGFAAGYDAASVAARNVASRLNALFDQSYGADIDDRLRQDVLSEATEQIESHGLASTMLQTSDGPSSASSIVG